MAEEASPGVESVRIAEVIAALSLATDLGIGAPRNGSVALTETGRVVVLARHAVDSAS